MNLLKQNKTMIIVIALVLIFLFIYMSSSETPATSSSTITVTNTDTGEREMLELLTDMKTIRLDSDLFEDEIYVNLQDFGREIIPEPIGRQDPFAPLESTGVEISGGEELSGQVLLR